MIEKVISTTLDVEKSYFEEFSMACSFELAGIPTAGKIRNSHLIGSQEKMQNAWKGGRCFNLSLSLGFIDSPYSARLTLDVTFKIRENGSF